jgi:CRP-like cAMP-binding protein
VAGSTAAHADELARLEFFAGCQAADLTELAKVLRTLTAVPGEVLFKQGEPASTFMLIDSGRAEVTHTAPDGEQTVVELTPGLIVGEIALLRGAQRTATVVVTEPVTGWIGGRDAIAAMLEVPCMSDRLLRTARQRLAAYITPMAVRLRDGSELFLRPVLPGDNARTARGPVEFSSETFYRRFQTVHAPSPTLMAYLFEVDYVDHFVWVMTDGADGPVVADARFVRLADDPAVAEVAFIVGDDYQGRGIGTFLMDALVAAARSDGVERFTARVLTDNVPMRNILEHYGAIWQRDDLNMIVTEFAVPTPRELALSQQQYREIYSLARHVIKAVG